MPDQSSASRAERRSNRHFTLPGDSSRKQQASEIGTSDKEDATSRPHQNQQPDARVAEQLVLDQAGMDLENLKALSGRSSEQNLKDSETMAQLFRTLYDFPRPTIAAVNGAAIAGGCGLATLCDFTLAVPDAKFGYSEVRIGFVPAIVSTFLLRQIGEKRARDLLLTGRIIEADEAHRIGLINEIVSAEDLIARARALALQLLENSPASLSGTKRLLSDYARGELDAQIRSAVKENAAIRATSDFREGISSFLGKRKPRWSVE